MDNIENAIFCRGELITKDKMREMLLQNGFTDSELDKKMSVADFMFLVLKARLYGGRRVGIASFWGIAKTFKEEAK